ncbi:hypothetical protein Sjap_003386 [Stephania japonica]|uniref:C2H2-type domain-containing protein n=1 Tax=Stephania japonica TaxID=461633 RepID=A0AAP0PX30_9MAGN
MPTVWFALKRSLHCKSDPSDAYHPKTRRGHLSTILTRKTYKSGCSRSISNLKDVINGTKTHFKKPPICSPRSIGSNEFVNPVTHEVILRNSRCKLRITENGCNGDDDGSTFVGTLSPGTPGPGGHYSMSTYSSPFRSSSVCGGGGIVSNRWASYNLESDESSSVICHKCGEHFGKRESADAHHLSRHAVTELVEGDSSRRIMEIICRTSWLKSERSKWRIARVLKVHNMQKTLVRFEEYREKVKKKASKLPKKHPRCLADGNELLRFYGTTIACSLGMNETNGLCGLENCNVCRIIRNGFSYTDLNGDEGVFTTSTSERAYESIEVTEENPFVVKSLIVCRVIAGRVHRPLESSQELACQSGFDSLAGKVGPYSNIEELYLLNPRALLPCFVVICKP